MQAKKSVISVNIDALGCTHYLQEHIKKCISNVDKKYDKIIFACIGTDKCTGDSLGPFVGYKLKQFNITNVMGDLENPLHALNLHEFTPAEDTLVIAIDACLGRYDHIGNIVVTDGSIKPGAGCNKDLPAIGDISIVGIVNFGGFMDVAALQSTRLGLVVRMADIIAECIESVMVQLGLYLEESA